MTALSTESAETVLRRQPLVKEFSESQVKRLAGAAEMVSFQPGDIVFREGDECHTLYVVVRGNVALELAGRNEVLRVETISAGGELGWSAMLMGGGRYFQARALDQVEALSFDAAELRAMSDADSAFGYALMRRLLAVVALRLQSTRLQIGDMHWTPAKRAGA